jgi:transcriptional regulator with XRE-family HTH domain
MLTLMKTKTLGARIRELREDKDYSLREFAKKLGDISAAHISDIELGRRFPSDALLRKIAQLLGVPVEELQKYDNRAPVEDIKRLSESDPAFGFALRKLIEKDVTPEDILRLTESKPDRGKTE